MARPQREPRPRGRRAHRVGAAPCRPRSLPTDALPPRVYKALVEGAATGTWPDGSDPGRPRTCRSSSAATARASTSPTGAGSTSRCSSARARPTPSSRSSRAWPTGSTALTAGPAADSIFVGLQRRARAARRPAARHLVTSDPCCERLAGGDFAGAEPGASSTSSSRAAHRAWAATAGSTSPPATATCTTVALPGPDTTLPGRRPSPSPTAAGAPLAYEIAPGRSGSPAPPHLTGTLTALGVHNRALLRPGRGHQPGRRRRSCRTTCCPLDEAGPVDGERAPDRRCPPWRSTCRPGRSSTCSSRRSATPSWA